MSDSFAGSRVMIDVSPESALRDIAQWLARRGIPFALVGGIAVSVRAEVRFTRDVDLALALSERELESLVRDLRAAGYAILAIVEHESAQRTATVRLRSRAGITIDVLAASSGIEGEIVAAAKPVEVPDVGSVPVAAAEDLLAMKILSMTPGRPQDRIDAVNLVVTHPNLDLDLVRARLTLIRARGFHREQDLDQKLADLLGAVERA